jgi:aminoglycoside 6'-N-acetyltransferase
MGIIKTHNITLNGRIKDYEIILCPLCDDHFKYLYKWGSDLDVLYWTESGTDITEGYDKETIQDIYGGVSQNAFCFLIIVNDIPIGECWLQKMNLDNIKKMYPKDLDVRRIDMAIGEIDYWNKGIGTKFIELLIIFAFEHENVDVLHCFSDDYNKRSRRIWEKMGFLQIFEEILPENNKGKIGYHYRLTREEYLNKKL